VIQAALARAARSSALVLRLLIALSLLAALHPTAARAQQVAAQEHVLPNGMRLLLLPRKGDPNVAAGWIARVGSVNERPGITGIAHLFEHMMFKGTKTIGTRDIERNLAVIAEMDAVKEELHREEADLRRRQSLGEIPDPARPEDLNPRVGELTKRLAELSEEERNLLVKNEFDKIYTAAGAHGMNAGTGNDFTVYFIQVPSNKLELWFWMESDRLLSPVFREFYSERDVVREERRMRIESTPTGRFEEQFEALFWQSSPYGWPVIGWPSDLVAITREEALGFFDVYYAPNNITACLVGDFDPQEVLRLAERYFGRLRRGPRDPEVVRTREQPQSAEQRMIAHAETKPEVRIRYHTVPDGHVDDYPLTLLAAILEGRTGRLYKSLVLASGVANDVSASQRGMKYEGYFELSGVAKPQKTPEEVEAAVLAELGKLKVEPIGERELQKVKNQFAASSFRQLRSSFSILLQLLLRDGYRGWQTINTDPPRLQTVSAEDIRRVAEKYFRPENQSVITFYTRESPGAKPDPRLESLSEEERGQVRRLQALLAGADAEKAREMLEALSAQAASAPPEKRKLLEVLLEILRERATPPEEHPTMENPKE
jgi:predicted Zn-dependent peptidase